MDLSFSSVFLFNNARMRTRNSLLTGFLLCCYGFPTGTCFYVALPSYGTASTAARSSTTPHSSDHVDCSGPRDSWARRARQRRRSPRRCVTKDASDQDEKHCARQELEGLSRRELQSICKTLGLRAVGKTSELRSRVLENRGQLQPVESKAVETIPSSIEGATAGKNAADSDERESQKGATKAQLLSAVDDGVHRSSSGSTGENPMAAEEAAPPSTDFLMEDVRPVFDELSDEQWAKVGQLGQLLTEWNGRINLISRKDIANVMKRHIVPCLAMAKALDFEDGIYVLDVGTGGGLPGLPLAICYPNVKFTLIDGTGKKITAVTDMAERLGLRNVRTFHVRAEEVYEVFDFVMGRAVTSLPKFVAFIDKNLKPNDVTDSADTSSSGRGNRLQKGVLYMRGEVSEEELGELGARPSAVIPLQRVLEEAGQDGDVGLGGGVDDRGYSSVFHFTSEAIWNRTPVTSADTD